MKARNEQLEGGQLLAPTLTRKDLESVFRVSGRTLERLVTAKKFPAPFHVGRSCRWKAADIVTYMDNQR